MTAAIFLAGKPRPYSFIFSSLFIQTVPKIVSQKILSAYLKEILYSADTSSFVLTELTMPHVAKINHIPFHSTAHGW